MQVLPLDFQLPGFQRPFKQDRVDKILSRWDISCVEPPSIAIIDGVPYLFDGQHTVAALKIWLTQTQQKLEWDCKVFYNKTMEEAARLFDIQNTGKTKLNGLEKFYATWSQANLAPDTQQMIKLIHKEGLSVAKVDDTVAPDCKKPLELANVYGRMKNPKNPDLITIPHDKLFSKFLKVMKIWKNQLEWNRTEVLRSIESFVIQSQHLSFEKVIFPKLSRMSLDKILLKAQCESKTFRGGQGAITKVFLKLVGITC